ncbi:hypothetical protein, partial [Limnohabitans sp.]|uniref:hypothetical protein n=1 Tax=Limnohabitans sp. TaxID=1907725 RepID=UPI0037BF5E44
VASGGSMEDVLGLRGAENHPPPAALVSTKSAHDDRITAGSRFNSALARMGYKKHGHGARVPGAVFNRDE